jgi:hypothetical protein
MNNTSTVLATLGILAIILVLIIIAIVIFEIVALWKFYKKCGKQGWECIIPFYNRWVLTEIADINWWWFLLMMITPIIRITSNSNNVSLAFSLITIFANFICYYNIAKKFHKDTGFAVLMTLFSGIVIPIMAFSKNYQYDKNVEVSKNGIIDDTNNNNNNTNIKSYCPNCGNPINQKEKYCPNCGKEIN